MNEKVKILAVLGLLALGIAVTETVRAPGTAQAQTRASSVEPQSKSSGTATARVTFAALTNYRHCIKDVDVTSDKGSTFRILHGDTTGYAVDLSSGGGLVRSWDMDFSACGNVNQVLELYVSSGAHRINYQTFTLK